MRGSRDVLSEGVHIWQRMMGEGESKYNYKRAIIGPPAKRHKWRFAGVPIWPSIECWLGSFVIFQGIRTSTAKRTIFLWFSGGGGVRTLAPSLWIRPWQLFMMICLFALRTNMSPSVGCFLLIVYLFGVIKKHNCIWVRLRLYLFLKLHTCDKSESYDWTLYQWNWFDLKRPKRLKRTFSRPNVLPSRKKTPHLKVNVNIS